MQQHEGMRRYEDTWVATSMESVEQETASSIVYHETRIAEGEYRLDNPVEWAHEDDVAEERETLRWHREQRGFHLSRQRVQSDRVRNR